MFMAMKKEHTYETGTYFITVTAHRWLPLFAITNGYDVVYNWFDTLRNSGHSILGYVIMPNHLHVLRAC